MESKVLADVSPHHQKQGKGEDIGVDQRFLAHCHSECSSKECRPASVRQKHRQAYYCTCDRTDGIPHRTIGASKLLLVRHTWNGLVAQERHVLATFVHDIDSGPGH